MPHRNPHYVQKKIELIESGLPIDISEEELNDLEEILRGARSFYIDIVTAFGDRKKKKGEDVEEYIAAENKNLAGVELALRKIDEFRAVHKRQITK